MREQNVQRIGPGIGLSLRARAGGSEGGKSRLPFHGRVSGAAGDGGEVQQAVSGKGRIIPAAVWVRETGAAPGVSGGAACTAAQGAAGGRAAAEGWISRGSGRGTPAGSAEYTAADGEGISPRDRAVSGLSAGRCAGLPALPGAKLQAVRILEGLFRCGPGAGAFPAL